MDYTSYTRKIRSQNRDFDAFKSVNCPKRREEKGEWEGKNVPGVGRHGEHSGEGIRPIAVTVFHTEPKNKI